MEIKDVVETLKPTAGRCLLKQERIKTQGKIIVLEDSAEKSKFCSVIAVGEDVEGIQKGDRVIADPYTGHVILETEDIIYTIMSETDILAVLEDLDS